MRPKNSVLSGLDVLLTEELDRLKGLRVGIVCTHSAITRDLEHITQALDEAGVNIVGLFGPEHGVRGDAADGAEIDDAVDPRLGVPVYSLYARTMTPTPEMLEGLDVMLIDIQDVGARFYTFPYTMAYVMGACGRNGVKVWVLDRPNPIGGLGFEGPILKPEFSSFVGLFATPVRHGFTTGELARLFRAKFAMECDLHVVKLKNWTREMWYDETGLPWVLPSPNFSSLDTAAVYTGTCYFEGTNVAEGRGTVKPFEIFGAPWIDAQELRKEMMSYDLPGVMYREAHFTPTSAKFAGELCSGLQFYVTDRNAFKPVLTGLAAVGAIRKLYPDDFAFRPPADGRYFFDLHAGCSWVREMIDAGACPWDIEKRWQDELAEFVDDVKSGEIMLY